ncbi:MAG: PAS domain-containing protein [Candidatus Altiarchaeota archaeon]|nr:PAS domain-containing protein [Candidatus Altiarchaeota archaeon]
MAKKSLVGSEAQYRATIDSMGELIHVIDSDFKILLINKALEGALKDMGLENDVVGKNLLKAFPYHLDKVRGEYEQVFKTGKKLITEEVTLVAGRGVVTETRKIPVKEGKDIVGVVTIIRDITERRLAEDKLRESAERFRSLVLNSSDLIMVVDPQGKMTYVSPSVEQMYEYDSEQLLGRSIFDFIHPEDLRGIRADFAKVLKKRGVSEPVECRARQADGSWVYLECICNNLLDDPAVRGVVINSRNITAHKNSENELRKERDLAHKYLDVASVIMMVLDTNGNISLMNRKGCEILGYTEKELLGRNWFDNFVPEKDKARVKEVFKKLMAGERDLVEYYETPILTKDGKKRVIAWHNTLLEDDGKITGTLSSGLETT